jgi:hypothetical protein
MAGKNSPSCALGSGLWRHIGEHGASASPRVASGWKRRPHSTYFLPEEVRLKAAQSEVVMTLRAVGRGSDRSGFDSSRAGGNSVEPPKVDLLPPLVEGSGAQSPAADQSARRSCERPFRNPCRPAADTPAAAETLPRLSCVVLKKDRACRAWRNGSRELRDTR